MNNSKKQHSARDAALHLELARLRSAAFVRDACVTLYDCLPQIPDKALRIELTEHLSSLELVWRRLDELPANPKWKHAIGGEL